MNVRFVSLAVLAVSLIILLGFGTSVQAFSNTTDFSFFDNTGAEGPLEGVQCTALKSFQYQVSVSQWAPTPNVVRITLADGDFTRYQIAGNGTLQLAGFARGGNTLKNQNFPDRCITVCAEVAGQMAGQVSVQTQESSKPKIKCNDIVCGPGGVAPECPAPAHDD